MNYREVPGISQSFLKKLATSPIEAKKLYDEDNAYHFKFGTMVDKMVKSMSDFNDAYGIITVTPSAAVQDIINEYLSIYKDPLLEHEEKLIEIGRNKGYSANIVKVDTYLKRLKNTETVAYASETMSNENKKIISEDEYTKVKNLVDAFNEEPSTQYYTNPSDLNNIEVINDVVIPFEYKGYKCKCEIDRVILNLDSKVITPIDFKSTGTLGMTGFSYSFFKYGYHLQDFFYYTALQYAVAKEANIRGYAIKGYTVEDFVFIVGESKDNPLVFAVKSNEAIRNAGKNGFTSKVGKFTEGIDQLLKRYEFHEIYGYGKYNMEYVKNGYFDIELI